MDSTTDEKIRVEQELLRSESLPTYHPQKPEPISSGERPTKMRSRVLIFALLVYSLLAIGLVSATVKDHNIIPATASAISELQRQFHGVLDAVKPAPLQRHSADKDQPCIDQNDTDTSRNDHKLEDDVAHDAVELAKRQTGNGNNTTTTTGTKVTSATDTSSHTSSAPSTTSSTTGSTASLTTTPSTLSGTTTTASQTSTTPSTSSISNSSSTTTPSSSSQTTTSSTTQASSTPTSTSSSPSTESITSLHIFTSVDGGSTTTITELTVVPAPSADETGTSGPSPTTSPSLQTGGASTRSAGLIILLGALVMALLGTS